jgi:hypothetical protein
MTPERATPRWRGRPRLIDNEPAGTEVLGDSAYGTGELRAHLRDRKMTTQPPTTSASISSLLGGDGVEAELDRSGGQAASACAAAAIFSAPWVVSCSTMRTKLGCSSPETRNVQR